MGKERQPTAGTCGCETQREERSTHAQKMESLGILAGGMAHDMNNILAAITAVASAMEAEMSQEDRYWGDVQDILSACRRGSALTRSLLGFARKNRINHTTFDLNDTVREVEGILSRTTPRQVSIVLDLASDLKPVTADQDQLSTALMNICLNGVDAMQGVGTLRVETRNVTLDEMDLAGQDGCAPGAYVRVSVSDTGPGIPPDLIDRVFEPFFTTKPKGKGTGLGLSTAYGVVRKHNGVIAVSQTGPGGTTFAISLPAGISKPRQAGLSKRKKAQAEAPRTVLLADDEDLFRVSARRILKRLGCRVLAAENGRKAIEIFERRGAEIDVVILDMMMPELDGRAAFEAIRAIDPEQPVIIASGYTDEGQIKDLLEAGAEAFLAKPFDLATLSKALAEIAPQS